MEYKVVMYHPVICGKCVATRKQLEKVMEIEDRIVNPDTGENMDFAERMHEKGLTQSPFVFIQDENGNTVDSWNDFQFKKIQEWVHKLS